MKTIQIPDPMTLEMIRKLVQDMPDGVVISIEVQVVVSDAEEERA